MLQVILKSFVRAEATVGVALVVLIITGRTDTQSIALSLAGLGIFFLIYGALPLMRQAPKIPPTPTKEEKALAELEKATETPEAPCSQKPFNRRVYFASAACMFVILLINAGLIYWLAPPLV
jgi:hypothetical protein